MSKIVKVQQSIVTNSEESMMLIYDEAQSVFHQEPLSDDVATLLGDRQKAYYEYELDKNNQLILGDEVEAQTW